MRFILILILYSIPLLASDFKFKSTHFESLPTSGTALHTKEAWAGWNWPITEGGLEAVVNGDLSPLQKIKKITNNQFTYKPLSKLKQELAASWHGYCDGTVLAAANYYCEPSPVEFITQNKETIHFNREEIKGILAYFYKKSDALNFSKSFGDREKYITPSQFHLALTQFLGTEKSFLAMIYGGTQKKILGITYDEGLSEIHNHLITHFESASSLQQPGLIKVETIVHYAPELSESVGNQSTTGILKQLRLQYFLRTNTSGKILSSQQEDWISEETPKILWTIPSYRLEERNFVPQEVKKLILQSIRHCKNEPKT